MTEFSTRSQEIRNIILDIFERGGRGHVPSAFSLVEILSTLYFECFNININNYNSPDRDRILLSKGHGCLALYAVLFKLGLYPENEFDKFCKVGGILGGHPTRGKVPGVEISAGSLGHGFSIAVGQAIALKRKSIDRKVVVILGDGECNEGSVWEAALSANKNKLDNLTVIIDYNKVQSYGATQEVCPLEPFNNKWKSFGFECHDINMVKNPQELKEIIIKKQTGPRAIICHTIKGQGSSIMEDDNSWHHKNKISADEIKLLRESLK